MPTSKDMDEFLDNKKKFVSLVGRLCELVENHGDELLVNSLSDEVLAFGVYELGPIHMEPFVLFDYSQLPLDLAYDLIMLYLKEYACAVTGDYQNAAKYRKNQEELLGKQEQISKLISTLRCAVEKQNQEQLQ